MRKARSCSACAASRRTCPSRSRSTTTRTSPPRWSRTRRCITGYKTYPHVDMYEAGKLAGGILVGALDGMVEPVMAWGWKPLLASIMRHAPEDGPSGDIIAFARRMEADGTVLAATLLPSFPHADTPYTGVSADRGRRRPPRRPRARAHGVQPHARDGVGAPRRVRLPRAAARRVGRAREGAGPRQSRRAGAAHRPLRQLRLRRRAGRDDRRRGDPEAGTRRRRHRADPRSRGGGHA